MKIDSHIHADFSSDSTIKMEELIEKAILCHYHFVAFTEHFDLLPREIVNYGILPLKKYKNRIENLREKYPQIHIAFGLEIGEPHRTKQLRELLFSDFKPDYVIGSLHLLKNEKNLSTPINFSLLESDIMLYYQEIVEMIDSGGFDTLGHLDIYKRELTQDFCIKSDFSDMIDLILKKLIDKNICLEINYSGFRAKINHFLPDLSVLKRYLDLGGELITIGSDSHRIDFFDKYFDQTIEILKDNHVKSIHYKQDNKWIGINI